MVHSQARLLCCSLLLCAVLASCGSEPALPAAQIAVEVAEVAIDRGGNPVILLRERDGQRVLPIWVGIAEARSIAARLEDIEPPRPNTHDLAKHLLDGLHAQLERVVVTELRQRTYYGLIVMRGPEGPVEVDARPSDAIALALRAGAPIFVDEALFDEEAADDPTREDEAPGRKIEEPTSPERRAI